MPENTMIAYRLRGMDFFARALRFANSLLDNDRRQKRRSCGVFHRETMAAAVSSPSGEQPKSEEATRLDGFF